jgi:hypothetical protein
MESSLEACRLKELRNSTPAGAKGFPIRNSLPLNGKVNIAIIPVDFSNAVGVGKPSEMYANDLTKIEEWGSYFSRGKMQYVPKLVSGDWVRAPKGAEWYTCIQCGKGAQKELQPQSVALQELINLVDPQFDFSGAQFIYFVFPTEAERSFGTALYLRDQSVQTAEGQQKVFVYGEMGGAFIRSVRKEEIWEHLIHELLHFQGFIGHGPINGSNLSILNNQWGSSQAITSWEAFLAGWFAEDEILCFEKEKIRGSILVSLDSIDALGEKRESVMIKLSEEELIIIEKRSDGPFSAFKSGGFQQDPSRQFLNLNDFTAYVVNVNKENYRNDSDPNSEEKNFWRYLRESGSIAIKNSVSYSGIQITRESEKQVRITKQ